MRQDPAGPKRDGEDFVRGDVSLYGNQRLGWVKILDVRRERLGDISFEDAQREGFLSPVGFSATWIDIHGVFDADEEVWVVEFEALK